MSLYQDQISQLRQRSDIHFSDFTHTGRNQVVIGGPGSGKTRVLLLKAVKLLEEDIQRPQGLACLTYSRKLARDLRRRIQDLRVESSFPNLFVGTLHSFCLSAIVRPFSRKLELPLPDPFRIASSAHQDEALEKARCYTKLYYSEEDFAHYRDSVYLDAQLGVAIDSNLRCDALDKLVQCYERILLFEEPKEVDFSMLVRASLALLVREDLVRRAISARYPWILVDEYQDLGYPLHRLLMILTQDTDAKCFVVGDPMQCIYQFQGARPEYLEDLGGKWSLLELEENHRACKAPTAAVKAVFPARNQDLLVRSLGQCWIWECTSQYGFQARIAAAVVRELVERAVEPGSIDVITRYRQGAKLVADFLVDRVPHRLFQHPGYRSYTLLVSWLQMVATWCAAGWKDGTVEFEDLFEDWLELWRCERPGLVVEEEFEQRMLLYRTLCTLRDPRRRLSTWLDALEKGLQIEGLLAELRKTRPDDFEHYQRIKTLVNSGPLQNLVVSLDN